jgi:hypothetical protein
MDAVREQLQKPLVIVIVAFVVGLLIGWFVIGWGLWPVQWTDATPEYLRQDLKEDYLRMAIDSYALNKDATLAKSRYEALGEDAISIIGELEQDIQAQAQAMAFRAALQISPILPGEATPALEDEQPEGSNWIRNLLIVSCGVSLLVVAGVFVFLFLRRRQNAPVSEQMGYDMPEEQIETHQAGWGANQADASEPPMVQFMASYKLGDDLFDDSFSIDSPAGEFLGECGVGISEAIGVGDPKKVTAFEFWLFDKNDIQTVTKVLMSDHAFNNEAIYQRLSAKGEPVLATPGSETVLETQTLQMVVRVVDMNYGDGALPSSSFFDRLVLELAIWIK